jgi:hypothetical protein
MDTLVHGVIGAVLCSRTGLPGGRRGPVDDAGRRQLSDWTLWVAFLFGILPDLASLGIHFSMDLIAGNGVRWQGIPDVVFVLYNFTHSLAGIALTMGFLVWIKRSLWLPALAWPIHVGMDILTHGTGVFMTPVLWPFSDWSFAGWSWWLHPSIFYASWLLAGGLWLVVLAMRVSWRSDPSKDPA